MKNFLPILIACVFFVHLPAKAQDGTEFVRAHLKAIGGEAAWKKINSLQFEGKLENEFELIRIKQYLIKGKSYRREMKFGGRTVVDSSQRYFVLIHQNKGWKKLPDQKGTNPLPMDSSEMAFYFQDSELEDPFVQSAEKGIRISYAGTEYFNEREYHKFHLSKPGDAQEFCYLDPKTFLIHMRVVIGSDNDQTKVYEAYKKHTDGLMLPSEIRSPQGVLYIDSVRVNPVLKSELFTLPDLQR